MGTHLGVENGLERLHAPEEAPSRFVQMLNVTIKYVF